MTKDEIINAFHPDFMKTYYPDFTKEFRTIEANQVERDEIKRRKPVAKNAPKRNRPNPAHINAKVEQSKTISEVRDELDAKKKAVLATKNFYTFSAAGAGNVKPKGKNAQKK
jgi:uncharacterized protein (DUF2225 family)